MKKVFDSKRLNRWFLENQRTFPWRENPTPYRVWISEVMLQQTRADVVIPYFHRWMERFPTIHSLARASVEEVIKAWEGLGYYSRARNLHATARIVVEKYGGELPQDANELKNLKGFGPYTIGAVRSFAFQQKAAAIDGNVLRVIARLAGIRDNICHGNTKKKITQIVEENLPTELPWVTMEGLIELGALVCKKKAECGMCPLRLECAAFREKKQGEIPFKAPREKTIRLHRSVAVIERKKTFLIQKKVKGVMADLWEFPFVESRCHSWDNLPISTVKELPIVKHTFTKYHATLYPVHFFAESEFHLEGGVWVPKEELCNLPFSSGHRQIARHLLD